MNYAIDIPNFGEFADPRFTARVACEAEDAGWDAVWVWDHIMRDPADPHADAWILLAAIALATSRVRLGPMVTPLARRRPWHLAREAVTIDHLSAGRLTLGVGNGSRAHEFTAFGDEGTLAGRAAMLDEGLTILDGLWSGRPFSFEGAHFRLREVTFTPVPLQQPRIPVWVGATWPVPAPIRRAAHWDGVWPLRRASDGTSVPLTPDDVRGVRDAVDRERRAVGSSGPFDIQVAGTTDPADGERAVDTVRAYAQAGATWWSERINPSRGDTERMLERVRLGPPRF